MQNSILKWKLGNQIKLKKKIQMQNLIYKPVAIG